jgi:multidrug transporter EmrE-like cation transporter
VTPLVTTAVLLAAVTHACWNAIAHRITDKLVGFTLIAGGGMLIGLALMPFVAVPAAGAWPYLLVSAVIHVLYYVLLMRSFRLGDFGQAYPIARGSAPLVVTVLAAVFAHEVPDAWAAAGIAVSCTGLTGVALRGMRGRRPNWAAHAGNWPHRRPARALGQTLLQVTRPSPTAHLDVTLRGEGSRCRAWSDVRLSGVAGNGRWPRQPGVRPKPTGPRTEACSGWAFQPMVRAGPDAESSTRRFACRQRYGEGWEDRS